MENEEELDKFELSASLVSCTIKLTREEGLAIKSLIQENYPHTFPHYCMKCGISTPNFYSTLNGERVCSLGLLNKILSGIHYQAYISNPEIHIVEIATGEIVSGVDSITPETESLLNDMVVRDIADYS